MVALTIVATTTKVELIGTWKMAAARRTWLYL